MSKVEATNKQIKIEVSGISKEEAEEMVKDFNKKFGEYGMWMEYHAK